MSVSEMQACLARIYVDDAFRKLFFMDNTYAKERYGLSDLELNSLRGLNVSRLEIFAASLRNKRKEQMNRGYPALFKVNPSSMETYFYRYTQLVHVNPSLPVASDLIDFGLFIEETLRASEGLPDYMLALARFERLCIWANQTSIRGPHPRIVQALKSGGTETLKASMSIGLSESTQVASFPYNVLGIEESLRLGVHVNPEETPQYIAFKCNDRLSGSKVVRLAEPTWKLILLCDGSRDYRELLRAAERLFDSPSIEGLVLGALLNLSSSGMITA